MRLLPGAVHAVAGDGADVTLVARGCRRVFGGNQAESLRRLLVADELEVGDEATAALATVLVACGVAAVAPAAGSLASASCTTTTART